MLPSSLRQHNEQLRQQQLREKQLQFQVLETFGQNLVSGNTLVLKKKSF